MYIHEHISIDLRIYYLYINNICRAIQHDGIVSVIGTGVANLSYNQYLVSSVVIVMERCDTDLEKLIKYAELHPMLKGAPPALICFFFCFLLAFPLRLCTGQILGILCDIAKALAFMHSQGFVHRYDPEIIPDFLNCFHPLLPFVIEMSNQKTF